MPNEIAKAYVQIIPTTKDIKSNLTSVMDDAGESAGESSGKKLGGNLVSSLTKAIAVASIGEMISKAITEGADLQQNLGGTEAVFGDFAKSIQETAAEAYKNMGLSASDYMATANKMGSLFQGSGVEQQEALDLTAKAMQRAADVASVMGLDTSAAMESIAGAAKGNFTMMDNLGVAMNATTIQAYALEKGINFEWNTASNAEKSQVAMQMFFEKTEQYAGNFAKESSETISGSLGSVKAAFSNVLGNLTLGNDIQPSLNVLLETVSVFLTENLAPAVLNIFTGLLDGVGGQLAERIPGLSFLFENLETVVVALTAAMIAYKAAMAMSALIETVSGVINKLKTATESQTLAQVLLNTVTEAFPAVVIISLIAGLIAAIVSLWKNNEDFRNAIIKAWGNIKEFISEAVAAISEFFTTTIPEAISKAITWFKDLPDKFLEVGTNIVKGVWDGIQAAKDWVAEKINGFFGGIVDGVKSFLGIHSPSKLFANEVGAMMAAGIGVGFSKEMDAVSKSITGSVSNTIADVSANAELSLNASTKAGISTRPQNNSDIVKAIEALGIKLDNQAMILDDGTLVGHISGKMDNALGSRLTLAKRGALA